LKSPKNAQRLQDALKRSQFRDGQSVASRPTEQAIAELQQELGIGKEER